MARSILSIVGASFLSSLSCVSFLFVCGFLPSALAQHDSGGSAQAQHDMKDTEATFRKIAGQLRICNISDVLYDRVQKSARWGLSAAEAALYKEVLSPQFSTVFLLKLLKDSDPKVRTLAILALYSKEEPQVLPAIADLVDDNAKTFPQLIPTAMAYSASYVPQPSEDVTVGYVANAVMKMYMEAGGYYYGVKGSGSEPGFSQYWAARKDRRYCAGWYQVALARASTGCSPTDKTRLSQIKALRAKIDKIPFPDKQWILLYLRSCNGADALVSNAELVTAMKELGPERLLNMLQYKIDSLDPDLKSRRSNNYPYHEMQLLVLKHAAEVLKPDQSKALLECEQWERDYQKHGVSDPLISPWWSIAAAELAPRQAESILRAEFGRLDHDFYGYQKAELAYALFRQCGLSQAQFLVDCFYDPQSLWKGGQYSNYRPQWLKSMGDVQEPGKKIERLKMLRKIVDDKRFQSLNDPSALRALAESLQALSGAQILSAEQKEAAWHPMGLDSFACHPEEARKKYPKESEKLMDVLRDWRASILNFSN